MGTAIDIKPGADEHNPSLGDNESLLYVADWTKEEEAAAKRKLDWILMPLLALGYFCLQLDRGNIANAITDNFMEDVGIDQDQFNVGQQLLSLGIVLTEIPANMILYRVGPGKWLTLQLFLFGTVSTFQAFQKGYAAFLITRFLLGISESGFIPGGLWTLSTWYTRKESAKRIIVFYFGNQLGQASSKLLAYGILHMRGVAGKPGWFWLFVLMGLFTLFSGILFGFFLPDSFKNPCASFLPGVSWFTEREIHILRTRVLLDDPMKGKKKRRIGRPAFKKAFTSWRLWVHFAISLLNNGPLRAFDTYAPSIVTSFGFPGLSSNALAAVGLYLQIPVGFGFSYVSDHWDKRGETVMAGLTCHLIGYLFNRGFTTMGKDKRGVKYFGVVWTQIFGTFSHPLNITWMSLTCTDSEERALAMTMAIMGANIAGIYGAQIFRRDDRPLYKRGFAINISVLCLGLVLAIGRYIDDVIRKRKKAQALEDSEDETSSSDKAAVPSEVQPAAIEFDGGKPVVSEAIRR